jgi:hypothetical protein
MFIQLKSLVNVKNLVLPKNLASSNLEAHFVLKHLVGKKFSSGDMRIIDCNLRVLCKIIPWGLQEEVRSLPENLHTEAILTLSPASLHSHVKKDSIPFIGACQYLKKIVKIIF